MSLTCKGIFIVGAKRTPFCKHGGVLREVPASHVFAAAAQDAMRSANVNPKTVDGTIVGNVFFLSQCDGGKTPRYCGIYSEVPIEKPALGVNKGCASGIQAVVTGALDILTGVSKITLTGGTEIMSALPFLVRNVRFGTALGGNYKFEDVLSKEFIDSFSGKTVQRMMEEIAMKHGVTREECDEYAFNSYLKFKAAQEKKVFDEEITTITVTNKKKEVLIENDEVGQSLTIEELTSFPPLLEDGAVITGGNCFSAADGASAVVLANEDSVKEHNLTPLARISGWACLGTNPYQVGLGVVDVVKKLIKDQSLKMEDVDLFEINTPFAPQAIVTMKQLRIDPSIVNVNGDAISMGHPVGATGARMITHLVHQLRNKNLKKGIVACGGGGQGIALLIERVS